MSTATSPKDVLARYEAAKAADRAGSTDEWTWEKYRQRHSCCGSQRSYLHEPWCKPKHRRKEDVEEFKNKRKTYMRGYRKGQRKDIGKVMRDVLGGVENGWGDEAPRVPLLATGRATIMECNAGHQFIVAENGPNACPKNGCGRSLCKQVEAKRKR